MYTSYLKSKINTEERRIEILQKIEKIVKANLFEFQKEGVVWLLTLYELGINGILADEMGLGKTLQTISMISYLYNAGISGPVLIIAPLSTLINWKHEFQRFSPSLSIFVYTSSSRTSNFKEFSQIMYIFLLCPYRFLKVSSSYNYFL